MLLNLFRDTGLGHPDGHLRLEAPMSNLLDSGRYLQCSDTRDHIYGFLGLHKSEKGLHHLLRPDYTRPTQEILRDATRYSLLQARKLSNVWRYLSFQSNEEFGDVEHLSWIPPWTRRWSGLHDAARLTNFFNADNSFDKIHEELDMPLLSNPNIFTVKGFVVDKVNNQLGRVLTQDITNSLDAFGRWLRETLSLLNKDEDPSAAPSVLMGGCNAEESRATQEDLNGLYDFQHFIDEEKRFPVELHESSRTGRERTASRFEYALRQACANRRPFRTNSGLVGIGPKVMQEGDVVVVLYGCETPYVLRQREDALWHILGECYVYGIMYGEAVRARAKDGEATDEVFDLI
jgi:hypothetical protein